MEKTLEQIFKEAGRVPPEQTMREWKELKEKMGPEAYWREYYRLAWEASEYRMTSPDPFLPPESRSKE